VKYYLLLIPFLFIGFAEAGLEQPTTAPTCEVPLKRCVYVSKNVTARHIVGRLNAVFSPGTLSNPEAGYMTAENRKKLAFWYNDEEVRTRVLALIPLFDVFEDFRPGAIVQLTTEIFSISEAGLTHINASIQNVTSNSGDATDILLSAIGGGSLDLSLRLGTTLLSSVLGSKKTKEESSKITTITQLVPNLTDIDFEHTTKIFTAPTAGVVKEQTAGLQIDGDVSIIRKSEGQERENLVIVKNYSFEYGVVTPGNAEEGTSEKVTILKFNVDELPLLTDTSTMVVSTHTVENSTGREIGLGSFGRNRNKLRSKIMVITRARPLSFDDFVEETNRYRDLNLHREFKPNEILGFPESKVSMDQVLEAVQPYAYFNASGDRLIGFRLNKKQARVKNIKRSVEISIKGGGLKMKGTRTVENLMLSGFKLNDLPLEVLDKPYIKFKLVLKPFKGRFKDRVKTTLYYNPETNKFIQQ
jgi:hypothetical protein